MKEYKVYKGQEISNPLAEALNKLKQEGNSIEFVTYQNNNWYVIIYSEDN